MYDLSIATVSVTVIDFVNTNERVTVNEIERVPDDSNSSSISVNVRICDAVYK